LLTDRKEHLQIAVTFQEKHSYLESVVCQREWLNLGAVICQQWPLELVTCPQDYLSLEVETGLRQQLQTMKLQAQNALQVRVVGALACPLATDYESFLGMPHGQL
jgi:hypothetical protein